ncbi:MAG: DUF1501 domain-containing protein [Acidobacteria bacterium]|nr:DUF1501 domain-containing protein [Acidobacteriota bacterium]
MKKETMGTKFWKRPAMDRRVFFRHTGAAVAGSFFLPGRTLETIAQAGAPVKGTAKYVVFVNMTGGPSHTDTFDLKEGAWTLKEMEPTTYGGIRWPRGLFPVLAEHMDSIAVLRSVRTYAVVHGIMQTWIQIGRNPLSGLSSIAPHIGSVVARELGDKTKVLPAFLSLNSGGGPSQGYLEPSTAPFYVNPGGGGLGNTASPVGAAGLDRRYGLLLDLDAETRALQEIGPVVGEMEQFNLTARALMYNPDVDKVFVYDATERARYGNTGFGNACIAARNLLRSNLGTRFVQINVGGWDMHTNIYTGGALNPTNAGSVGRTFDLALGRLIGDLKADGLLGQTLILAMGEFGRTTGMPNSGAGRDHHMQQAVMVAGAGVKGGLGIGRTNDVGSVIMDPGWSRNREIRPEDIEATIYSALGIDYTKVYRDDPLNRGFALVPTNQGEEYGPVDELWGA